MAAASAKEHCCRSANIAQGHSAARKARPIHILANSLARTWIHGLSDLIGVRFATLVINNIVIIPSRPEAYCFGSNA
jgi:hypothetical protein